jgi:hypothetical protein
MSDNWLQIVSRRLNEMDWQAAVTDVQPFLADSAALECLTKENILRLLDS